MQLKDKTKHNEDITDNSEYFDNNDENQISNSWL